MGEGAGVTWRILVDWLPDNDETRAIPLAHGRICHLEHEEGAETSDMHAYFEVSTPADWKLLGDEPDTRHRLIAATVFKDYPRFKGSVWDIIATALQECDRGRPQ